MRKTTLLLGFILSIFNYAQTSDTVKQSSKTLSGLQTKIEDDLKITGYIQTQFQVGQKDAQLKVGEENTNKNKSFNRLGIRRGRIKLTYKKDIATAVFQVDITEKDVDIKDAYLILTEPWLQSNSLKIGAFKRPFGNEIGLSSSSREIPEVSNIYQKIFSDDRDLGAMITLQAPESSPLHILKLETGVFTGNGLNKDNDNKKDFSSHLSMLKEISKNFELGLGISYFKGKVYLGTENKFVMKDGGFILETVKEGSFTNREYYGFDGQFTFSSALGESRLNAEYIFGTQPGSKTSSKSFYSSTLPDYDTYIRKFQGGYITFIQEFNYLPISVIFRYDWYDPNTRISKESIGNNETGIADISYNTFGFGILWEFLNSHRLSTYYEIVDSEEFPGMQRLNENVFTLRYQFKF